MDFKNSIWLMRIGNCMLASFSVLLGYLLTWNGLFNAGVIPAMLAVFFATGFANTVNDVHDIEIDRKLKKNRPLASGKLSEKQGVLLTVLLAAATLILSFIASFLHFEIALIAIALIYLYSAKMKKLKFLGNFVVAGMIALTYPFGALFNQNIIPALLIAFSAFLINVAREIAKDLEDLHGDKGLKKTFPIMLGEQKSKMLAHLFSALSLLPTVYGIFLKYFKTSFFIIVFVLSAAMIMRAIYSMYGNNYGKAQSQFKQAMILITLAIAGEILMK